MSDTVYPNEELQNLAASINSFLYGSGGSMRVEEFLDPNCNTLVINTRTKRVHMLSIEERFIGLHILAAMDYADIDIPSAMITLTAEGKDCGSRITRHFIDLEDKREESA